MNKPAATASVMWLGTLKHVWLEAQVNSASAPEFVMPSTRSPTAKPSTSSPMALTMPANSLPG